MTSLIELFKATTDIVASNPILAFVASFWILGFYARPVSIAERANLVVRAEGSDKALELAHVATSRRYLNYFCYEELLKRVDSIVRRENAEAVVARAFGNSSHHS